LATNGAPAPEVRDIMTADRFLSFTPETSDFMCRMLNEAVNKFSMKDPMLTSLFKLGLLPVHQSAYWRFHSTETTLLMVVTDITRAVNVYPFTRLTDRW